MGINLPTQILQDIDGIEMSGQNEIQKLVWKARLQNLSKKVLGRDCKITNEEHNDGFKRALYALQGKNQTGIQKRHDQLSQLVRVGSSRSLDIRENTGLIQETLDVIYGDIIPEARQISALQDAVALKKRERITI